MIKITGPFTQLVTLSGLPLRGKINDEQIEVIPSGGLAIKDGNIYKTATYAELQQEFPDAEIDLIEEEMICVPAFTDAHTHICFGGSRATDFAMRNAGKTYLEIAEKGGGIWSSVQHTREASADELLQKILQRIESLLKLGITTIEIKSGYGLNVEHELKMLRVIKKAQEQTCATLIPTCLAAHLKPKDFEGGNEAYLTYILKEILPAVREEKLAERVDIFIEKSAFQPEESRNFLLKAKEMGFQLTVHADQFTPGSSRIAVETGAHSADHLEATVEEDLQFLAQSDTVATALPGASLGLGEKFTPARKILDAGGILAIASDWNPGSAPMGNLITQASILATFEKLTTAEVLAGITFRAAHALNLDDRGKLETGQKADFALYKTNNFHDILYHQGSLTPAAVYCDGNKLTF